WVVVEDGGAQLEEIAIIRTGWVGGCRDGYALSVWVGGSELADKPAVGHRVVQDDGVAAVACRAGRSEAAPYLVAVHGAVYGGAALVEYLQRQVRHLHEMVGADIAVGIGRVDAVAVA